eukprot:1842884-Amphidinium_carterae.1
MGKSVRSFMQHAPFAIKEAVPPEANAALMFLRRNTALLAQSGHVQRSWLIKLASNSNTALSKVRRHPLGH